MVYYFKEKYQGQTICALKVNMKVLVTGASGFIGQHLVERLLESRHQVIATSRDAEKAKSCTWYDKVLYIQRNLNDTEGDMYKHFQTPDVLIHLSWDGLPNYNDLFHIERNLPSSYYLIKNLLENGLKKLLVLGTCFEYGLQEGSLSEDMDAKPVTYYGLAKDTLRRYISQFRGKYDFQYQWIRLFYVYGKGQSSNSILSQLERALANGDAKFNMSEGLQLRDYLSVDKAADYIVRVLEQKQINGIINCCSGRPISIKSFVENYLSEKQENIELNLGYYPYPDYEPKEFWGDVTKLNRAIKIEQ